MGGALLGSNVHDGSVQGAARLLGSILRVFKWEEDLWVFHDADYRYVRRPNPCAESWKTQNHPLPTSVAG